MKILAEIVTGAVLALLLLVYIGLLVRPSLAQSPMPRLVASPWADAAVRVDLESKGWDFRTTFGLDERMCFALPPGKQWPPGSWSLRSTRDAAVAAGAIEFPPHPDDMLCHAGDLLP